MINSNVKAGDTIYVYECDDGDESITGYMLLAKIGGYSICSSFVDGENDLDAILNYHMLETATEYNTELFVFPNKNCYSTLGEARTAHSC